MNTVFEYRNEIEKILWRHLCTIEGVDRWENRKTGEFRKTDHPIDMTVDAALTIIQDAGFEPPSSLLDSERIHIKSKRTGECPQDTVWIGELASFEECRRGNLEEPWSAAVAEKHKAYYMGEQHRAYRLALWRLALKAVQSQNT